MYTAILSNMYILYMSYTLYAHYTPYIRSRYDFHADKEELVFNLKLSGHTDSVTGLSLSPDDHHLLSNAMDCHIYSWDVRPFVLDDTLRCEREYMNVHHGAEKNLLRCAWSSDQEYVTCGSADRYVY